MIPNKQRSYRFDWVTPGVVRTTVNDTVYYTFGPAFFATIGDGDGVIEPGESFSFCDSVTVQGNCSSQGSNVTQSYRMTWGCGGNFCQSMLVSAEGVIALAPTRVTTRNRSDFSTKPNLCDTCGTGFVRYGFEFINRTQAVLATGGFLTNIKLELGTAKYPYSISSTPILDSANHCFDSVRINGVSVPFKHVEAVTNAKPSSNRGINVRAAGFELR